MLKRLRINNNWEVAENNLLENIDLNNIQNEKILYLRNYSSNLNYLCEIYLDIFSYENDDKVFRLLVIENNNINKPKIHLESYDINELILVIEKYISSNYKQNKNQPFRIPSGWYIACNHLFENMDPAVSSFDWDRFDLDMIEDILLIRNYPINKYHNLIRKKADIKIDIDLGWYPEGDPDGIYKLVVIENNNWDKPKECFEERSLSKIVLKIEEFLLKYNF